VPELSDRWTHAIDLDRLRANGRATVKLGSRQLALFVHDGAVLACNNRCPHEGYPLVEGALDDGCLLTCHWHNWKFDLRTGENRYGGDSLRVYPVKVEAGAVWVDVRDAPRGERVHDALVQLDAAMDDHDAPRIARELARLARADAGPEVALERAIVRSHERLRYGMTHAWAGAEVWLRLRDTLGDADRRLACAAEALSHIAYDTLREPVWAFEARASQPWNAEAFLAAIEAQDEAGAVALLDGAREAGLRFADLEGTLAAAALAHYNDFGHALIYLGHVGRLVERLGPSVESPLLRGWTRMLVYATREDLLPDFRYYAPALAQWQEHAGAAADERSKRKPTEDAGLDVEPFVARSVRDTLAATLAALAQSTPLEVHHVLMRAAAIHLLRFDVQVERRTDNPVTDNVGWLDFSHALTFGHAVREFCIRHPGLWKHGLLQMALFVGRNTPWLAADDEAMPVLRRWAVADAQAFDARCMETLLDHGLAQYIYPVHLVKTSAAVRDEIALGVPDATAAAMRAAVNRLFDARFKQRHLLRTARQALGFVAREDGAA
jgi:nitrite reductase/ring-hydroxylating ferredoxin subunit